MAKAKQIEEQEKKEKEFFNLWWEYLKRSDNYEEFCKIVRENFENEVRFNDIKWPKKFQEKKGSKNKLFQHMFDNFVTFRDIYIKPFDYWWEVRKITKERELKDDNNKGVKNYDFEQDINSCIEFFKKDKGREPTLKEFKDKFLFYKTFPRSNFYLKIDLLTPNKTEDLVKQIGKIVKERRRNLVIRGMRSYINLEPFLSAKVKENYSDKVHADLRMYLDFYDKSKRLSMPELMESEKMNYELVDERRVAYLYIQKAKKIIRNVELFIFPGDYQPKKTKKD